MAQIREVRLIDDLDGESADETVEFGIDGKNYEIDLSKDNAGKLRDALAGSSRPRGARVDGAAACHCERGARAPAVHRPRAEPGDPGVGAQAGHEGLRPRPYPGRGARGVPQGELRLLATLDRMCG